MPELALAPELAAKLELVLMLVLVQDVALVLLLWKLRGRGGNRCDQNLPNELDSSCSMNRHTCRTVAAAGSACMVFKAQHARVARSGSRHVRVSPC